MHSLGSRIVGYCPVYIQCSCGHANVYNIFQKQDPWVKVYDNVMTLSMDCQIASPRGSSYHILFSFYICACWNSDKYSRGFSADPWGSLSSVQLSSLESSSPQILATVAFSDFNLCLSNSVGPKGSVLGSSSLCYIQHGSCLQAGIWCNSACFPPLGITVLYCFFPVSANHSFMYFFFWFSSGLRQIK